MIVKILQKSSSFKGVSYNHNKISKEKGELMRVRNFDLLRGFSLVKPSDYVHYLEAVSAKNTRIKYPQFHAVISCKGRELDKMQLSDLAEKWLEGMGYAKQPYLLIHHSDTANNHIHIVSTRVNREGKKINDSFERIRAYEVLEKITAEKSLNQDKSEVDLLLKYQFSTISQLGMLLEAKGYHLSFQQEAYHIYKFGKMVYQLNKEELEAKMQNRISNADRKAQLKAILLKYKALHSALPVAVREKLPGGGEGKIQKYHSRLSDYLKQAFGLSMVFHFSGDKPPYGYTIIDHAERQVFKGSDVLKLKELVRSEKSEVAIKETEVATHQAPRQVLTPDEQISEASLPSESLCRDECEPPVVIDFSIDISDDIDDEQILGKNRRKKGVARTNTR